jgi:short-subunit dehydrogenase
MHKLLPKFRERREGCIINIASRYQLKSRANQSGGTVNGPMAVQYNAGKAALIRAVGCIQEDLNLDNQKNIHVYALHPGGVFGALQGISYDICHAKE